MTQQSCSLVFTKRNGKLYSHKNMHTDVYGSFIHNYQNLEATRCLSVGECISILWCIQTMDYYSELKRNELLSHETTWRKLKCALLSERNQYEKALYYMIPTMWHSGKGKTLQTLERWVVRRGWERRKEWIGRTQKIFGEIETTLYDT